MESTLDFFPFAQRHLIWRAGLVAVGWRSLITAWILAGSTIIDTDQDWIQLEVGPYRDPIGPQDDVQHLGGPGSDTAVSRLRTEGCAGSHAAQPSD